MRIVHTSDWHIGRRFEREPLEDDQRAFLSWLATVVEEHGVDLVVVAGDVYDRALPAEEAVAALDEGLDGLRAAGATVAMISGNHDSARRLGFGARRQAQGGVHVFADVHRAPEPWIFEAGGEAVAVVPVPYLDPLTSPAPRAAPDGAMRPRTHEHVLADALVDGRAALARYPGLPSLAVAHATVVGGARSDSEKVLAIGGAEVVAAECFEGFDAVLLGHLHRPQPIGRDGRIAYSGSPLPYSFSEAHPKSIRLIDVADGAVASVRELGVPVGRPVATIEGELEELLADPSLERYAEHWVAARLTDSAAQVQPMERLRRRFSHAVSVSYASPAWTGRPGDAGAVVSEGDEGPGRVRAPEEVVLAFLSELSAREPEGWERELALEAVAAAHRAGVP